MGNHRSTARELLRRADEAMVQAADDDELVAFDKAVISSLMAIAEATLELAEQQRICNETTLYAEAAYEATDRHASTLNPTDMSVVEWAHDLHHRIKGD